MKKLIAMLLVLCLSLLCAGALCEAVPAAEETAAEGSAVQEVPSPEEAEVAQTEAEAADPEPYTGIRSIPSMITLGILLVVMAAMVFLSAKRIRWNASMIAKAAMTIALAYVLSMVRLFRMPQGGSITLISMLPIILFSLAFGPMEGMVVGFGFGILQLLLDPYVIHPIQLLVDYPMAYGAVALACAAGPLRNDRVRLPLAALLGYFGRLVMAVLSGVVFFSEYAGEQNALIYSLGYNIAYLGPEALICAVVMLIPGLERLVTVIRGKNLKTA